MKFVVNDDNEVGCKHFDCKYNYRGFCDDLGGTIICDGSGPPKEPVCKFCLEYEDSRKKSVKPHLNAHFKVCMYEYYTFNRKVVTRHTHKPTKLNYCPECGKKLKGVPR